MSKEKLSQILRYHLSWMSFTIIFARVEIAIRIEEIADEVNELERLAYFACNGPDLKDYEGIVGQISYSF